METIPSELWTEIFAFACTDDGSTGRALSSVSRAVHLISKPLKYQSLCVIGLHQLLKLLATLSDLPPGERKVKYLFIAGLDDCRDFESPDGGTGIRTPLYADPSRAGLTEKTLGRILRLVATRLFSLSIHRTTIARQSLLPKIDLPLLAELTLHGPFESLQPTNLRPRALFPCLRRIQINHFANHPTKFLEHIVLLAPNLTHLRAPQSSFTPYDIQVALGLLQPTASAGEAVYLPSSLQELVIEVGPVTGPLDSWESNIRATQFSKNFQKIAENDGRVFLVDGLGDWMSIEQARQEWLQGIRPVNFSYSGAWWML
ncbi:hypothetical protein MVEN_02601200 [Mycena venus]|uniref:Uncharacterized protein n=1 Tax=Mycena venus TaxID=2733690 RepID=A0A8H6WR95_9AGAR|nr:hypothetical protein MVEN_02601200 [Mycena venus]